MTRIEIGLGLALVLVTCACNRDRSGEPGEAPPAPPCSVNGMLFRDTPATEFERCGASELPLEGEARSCVEAALRDQRPFVVELTGARPVPAHRRPALVGAVFDGRYALRSYVGDEREGRRETMVAMFESPDANLALLSGTEPTRRCVLSEAPPDPDDPGWRPLAPDARGTVRGKLHAGRCVEWFDRGEWERQPWDSRFDPRAGLGTCELKTPKLD